MNMATKWKEKSRGHNRVYKIKLSIKSLFGDFSIHNNQDLNNNNHLLKGFKLIVTQTNHLLVGRHEFKLYLFFSRVSF